MPKLNTIGPGQRWGFICFGQSTVRSRMAHTTRIATWFHLRKAALLVVCLVLSFFLHPRPSSSAQKSYYYVHVSSFRAEKNANRDARRLRGEGYTSVVRREKVRDLGYWYRVYIGPFTSLREANLKKVELKSKKLVKYAAVRKEKTLIQEVLPRPPEVAKKKAPPPVYVPAPPPKKPPAVPPMAERPSERKKPPVLAAPTPPAEISLKPRREVRVMPWKGKGRNMPAGNLFLGLGHTYRETETELTSRKKITTTTIEDVVLSDTERKGFSTSFNMDSLKVRFGLSNSLEAFAEIAGTYQETSNFGSAYGGGLRLNVFEIKRGQLRGLYGALQGEYLGGEVEYEYSSADGNTWQKDAEWQELSAKVELGLTRAGFAGYAGTVYLRYREDTERELVPPTATPFVFQDELEGDGIGVYGGVTVRLSSAFLINIEGQAVSQESVFGAIEYRF